MPFGHKFEWMIGGQARTLSLTSAFGVSYELGDKTNRTLDVHGALSLFGWS